MLFTPILNPNNKKVFFYFAKFYFFLEPSPNKLLVHHKMRTKIILQIKMLMHTFYEKFTISCKSEQNEWWDFFLQYLFSKGGKKSSGQQSDAMPSRSHALCNPWQKGLKKAQGSYPSVSSVPIGFHSISFIKQLYCSWPFVHTQWTLVFDGIDTITHNVDSFPCFISLTWLLAIISTNCYLL